MYLKKMKITIRNYICATYIIHSSIIYISQDTEESKYLSTIEYEVLKKKLHIERCSGKQSIRICNTGYARDAGSISGLRRSPGVGSDKPLQCSCWENSMDREP